MCGIAGWIGVMPNAEWQAGRMARTLRHRGPDAQGARALGGAVLVHTRLSIIDLSSTGAQPMANEDGTVWTVFNGEIYNHGELQRQLESRGHQFRGRSDTEVVPHAFEEYGPRFVDRLAGMFAFALFDTRTQRLLLARDRFGIKPLFYAVADGVLAFASEIGALKGVPGIDLEADAQAISDFVALAYIPAPETFYRGIRALEPGQVLEASCVSGRVSLSTQRYHSWSITLDPRITMDAAVERADALVGAAVSRQLESDVPIGALLSGGIDSSLVSAAAQAALGGRLRTYNARFAERTYDESWAAEMVAEHIGSAHSTLDMAEGQGTAEHISDLLLHCGQPFADTSLFSVNAVCRAMRQHVTVALSGDGGDEAFAGYSMYTSLAPIAWWQRVPPTIASTIARGMNPLAGLGLIREQVPRRLSDMSRADDATILQNLFCWVREDEQRLLMRGHDVLPARRLFEAQWPLDLGPAASAVERLSARATEVCIRLQLPNDFLFKVDIASMREGLEVRVPMLDESLVAFGLSLSHRLKVRRRETKAVLRAVARRRLPAAVAQKPKWGFETPMTTWVDESVRGYLQDVLLSRGSSLRERFDPKVYAPMVRAFCDGSACAGISRSGLHQRVFMLLALQLAFDDGRRVEQRRA